MIKIKRVAANSAAAQIGLREGDEVVAVNGRPAFEYGLDRLSKMFRREGAECRLIVRRGGKLKSVRLKMKRAV